MLHREWWRVEVEDGERHPAGFGFAYMVPPRRVHICWRWPLNHPVAWLRWFWFRYLHAAPLGQDLAFLRAERDAWERGYQQGRYDLIQEIKAQVQAAMTAKQDTKEEVL